jgi:hypothetical protein
VATHAHGLPYEDDLDVELDASSTTAGWWELGSVLVLVVAGVGLPIAGWLAGIGMVHQSHAWTARDRRIATVAPLPFVAAAVAWAALADPPLLLHFGPLGVLAVFGGAIAGVVGGAYLTVRAFLSA